MKVHFSQVHWDRVLLTGVLVVILVLILDEVLLWLTGYVWGPQSRTEVVYHVIAWSRSMLAILLTAGGAVWVARKGEKEVPLHGFLVGLVAALIFFSMNPDVTNFFQGAFHGRLDLLVRALLTFVLMVVAGWLGGLWDSRERKKF
jgi:hypothetical protein